MDEKDRKILKLLQENGRVNYNEIANKLKLSNATIHARIIKLKRKGIIDGFTVNVNPAAVDKNMNFFLSITVNHEEDDPEKTISDILKMKDVVDVYCVTGDWDYHIIFYTKDVDSMKETITAEIKKSVPHIIRSSAQIVLEKGKKSMEV